MKLTPVMMCLRCGYVQEAYGDLPTSSDRVHMRRCDYTSTIRYLTKIGITGGARRDAQGTRRIPEG